MFLCLSSTVKPNMHNHIKWRFEGSVWLLWHTGMSCETFGQVCSQSTTEENASSILWIHFTYPCWKEPIKSVWEEVTYRSRQLGEASRPIRFVADSVCRLLAFSYSAGGGIQYVSRVRSTPWASKAKQKTCHPNRMLVFFVSQQHVNIRPTSDKSDGFTTCNWSL